MRNIRRALLVASIGLSTLIGGTTKAADCKCPDFIPYIFVDGSPTYDSQLEKLEPYPTGDYCYYRSGTDYPEWPAFRWSDGACSIQYALTHN